MSVQLRWIFSAWLAAGLLTATTTLADDVPLVKRHWFEARSAHFNIYSCGEPARVFRVAGELEQFCATYSQLAGAQALASPPIVVIVFPDHESMVPFLPLYQGQPENLAGFFVHGDDENLIVLSLPPAGTEHLDMSVVFHEYTHLLLRRNDSIWPLWLKEGMAEIYSTFEMSGSSALIAQPIRYHLRLLTQEPMMPLKELFSVTHDSPQYNERARQGAFYAESWLLTHLLFVGDDPRWRKRFANFTPLLRAGQTPEQAFTNAMGMSLAQTEVQLRNYLACGQFAPLQMPLPSAVVQMHSLATRPLTPVENYFRLGDELMRINRPDEAKTFFADAQKLAPASPLPYEGFGLLAIRRDQPDEALQQFKESLKRGSASYLTHYYYALKKFRLMQMAVEKNEPITADLKEIHDELLKSLVLMGSFGGAHELFGILEMAGDGDHSLAEQHLQLAVQLEPENLYYQLALAEAQFNNQKPAAARQTLSTLLLPNVEAELRSKAEALMRKIGN
ncbi:MAG TPA: tetratricopeptide repeat protein [Verrucomicrobiae bacterium]|jgi:tetratricopeptide (TPR) repeat protein